MAGVDLLEVPAHGALGDSLALEGATLAFADGTAVALAHTGLGPDSGHRFDNAPTVTGVEMTSIPGAKGFYALVAAGLDGLLDVGLDAGLQCREELVLLRGWAARAGGSGTGTWAEAPP